MSLPDAHQLEALMAVIDEESFDAAADALGITPPAVSQRIKALETAVGQILVRRTRPVGVTDAGRAYLRLARQVSALARDVQQASGVLDAAAPNAATPATIPLAINSDSLGSWVLQALAPLSGAICFDIHREDQDHSAALLRDGTVMAAITTAESAVQGCTVTRLGVMRYRAMAHVDFAASRFPHGVTAAALRTAPVVVFDRKDDLQDSYLRAHDVAPHLPPRHYVPSSADYAEAVRLGMGWGLLPDSHGVDSQGPDKQGVDKHGPDSQRANGDTDGTLVDISPGQHTDVTLFWQQWSLRTSALDRTAHAILQAAAKHLA